MSEYTEDVHQTHRSGEAPAMPLWLLIVRGIQGFFALLSMALAANATTFVYVNPFGMAIFTFIWTLLFLLYIFLAPKVLPQLYLFWAHVGFEATVWLFWLVTFALLADYVRLFDSYGYRVRGNEFVDSVRASFAFALLNWFLFSATLIFTISNFKKNSHPTTVDGAHTSTPGGGFSFGTLFSSRKGASDAEKGVGHNGAGPVNEAGQPVEMQHGAGHAHQYQQGPDQSYQQPTHTPGGYEQPR